MLKTILVFALFGIIAAQTATFASAAPETRFVQKPSSYEKLPPAKKGGIHYDSIGNNPKVMNPLLSNDANSSSLEGFLWTSLFTEDSENLNPLPLLATGYTISSDRKTYTFTVRNEAAWEDGTPVTTDDVKFTFDSMMDPKVEAAPLRSYWEGVTLEVTDAKTFKFKVGTPKFDTLRQLYLFVPIQKKSFAGEADYNKAKAVLNPVGNGPYRLKSFSRDQKIELERKKDWWGYQLPHFANRHNPDLVVLRIITDPNLAYEKFLKGELDINDFAGPGIELYVTKVLGTDKGKVGTKPEDGKNVWATEIHNKAPRGFSYVGWNLKRPLFASKKTRQALARLADYQQIIDKVFHGFSYQSTSPFGSLTMNASADVRLPERMLTFDRKKAIALLKEDGWSDTDGDNILDKMIDGKKTPFRFVLKFNSNNPARGKIAQILKENLKAAGIEMEIRSMEWNAFLQDVDTREFDSVILGWTATPYPNPKQTWHTDAEKNQGSNFVSYSNKTVDGLIEKANLEFDLAKRAKVLQKINEIIYDDQPYLFLLEPRSMIIGFNKKVKSPVWAQTYNVGAPSDLYQFTE